MPVSTISTDTPVVTLVNVFTVDPERQEELLAMLEQATEEVIRHLPGFVSANFHRGLDGTKVLNYAQWESREAFEAMFRDPVAREHLEATGRLSTSSPALYELRSVHHP